MRRAIIVDMDGTLALKGNRSPFDYARCIEDACNQPVALVVRAYTRQYRRAVVIVSGREVTCAPETRLWLQQHEVPYTALLMRAAGDYRKDAIVKREIYETQIAPHWVIDFVLDDRAQVIRMWRDELCLPTFQVADGDF